MRIYNPRRPPLFQQRARPCSPAGKHRRLPACTVRRCAWRQRESCLKDHYSALGVSSAATLAEIKTAYRQQAALHHPDRNSAEGAAARFRGVQEAYEVLSDDARRNAYDNNRKRNLLDNPLETAGEIWAAYFNRLI